MAPSSIQAQPGKCELAQECGCVQPGLVVTYVTPEDCIECSESILIQGWALHGQAAHIAIPDIMHAPSQRGANGGELLRHVVYCSFIQTFIHACSWAR